MASLMTRDVLSLTIRGGNDESAPGLHSLKRLTARESSLDANES